MQRVRAANTARTPQLGKEPRQVAVIIRLIALQAVRRLCDLPGRRPWAFNPNPAKGFALGT